MEDITCILQGCMHEDRSSQKALYERYYGFAFKTVFLYIYRYDKAVDLVNDGFIKFFKSIDRFKPGPDSDNEKILMAWLKKIMINTAIDELRRGKMSPEIGGIPEHIWDIKDEQENAEQKLSYKELILMIKTLSPQNRSVFLLYAIHGYNHVEIAKMLDMQPGTSKSCLSRARVLLQEGIKKREHAEVC